MNGARHDLPLRSRASPALLAQPTSDRREADGGRAVGLRECCGAGRRCTTSGDGRGMAAGRPLADVRLRRRRAGAATTQSLRANNISQAVSGTVAFFEAAKWDHQLVHFERDSHDHRRLRLREGGVAPSGILLRAAGTDDRERRTHNAAMPMVPLNLPASYPPRQPAATAASPPPCESAPLACNRVRAAEIRQGVPGPPDARGAG